MLCVFLILMQRMFFAFSCMNCFPSASDVVFPKPLSWRCEHEDYSTLCWILTLSNFQNGERRLFSYLTIPSKLLNFDNSTIADSAQTEYCPTFHCSSVHPYVTGVTSYISHIHKGINAMLIIRGPIKPYISDSKSSWLSF